MALGMMPYRGRITLVSFDGLGTYTITVEVRDGAGVLRNTLVVQQGVDDGAAIRQRLNAYVLDQAITDAGSLNAFLTAMASAANQSKEWALGSPAFVPTVITLIGVTPQTWANMPSALTEVPNARIQLDLSLATQARFSVNTIVAGNAGATLALQFSTNGGSTWTNLDGVSGPSVAIGSIAVVTSAWVNLVAAAQADVLVRIVGQGGNAVIDPQFGLSVLQVR